MAIEKTEGKTTIPSAYDPKEVENKWYRHWEEGGFFEASENDPRPPFSIVIPPPNVTGQLHLGHALNNTLQDILVRWRRMSGYNTLWLPGTDHAGIATQAKVEEELAEDGLSRHDLGRERFLERVWDWKTKYGARITHQLRRMGSSCDWSRERFTLDPGLSRAVREVFVRLYEKGLIYRGRRIINWCPRCHTAISDIEVEHEDKQGRLWYIRYPFKDGSGSVTVATTRPETMLGDTAVAVHPDDERYKSIVGKTVILPLLGREIPVVADAYVDPSFGTGAVKVTPAHDPNDFEIGQRHDLHFIQVIGFDAVMISDAGPYAGMERYACRKQVVNDLESQGYLLRTEDHAHAVGQCSRCDTVIEPLVSDQWFVRMAPLAEPAIAAVKDGRIRFVPERFAKLYLHWMENIRDWCISRQLWWGHRIPVWYCQDCGKVIVAKEDPKACPHCEGLRLEQDPDVLDTWFSSALWPFSTMGWPNKTKSLEVYYPTSVLVTAFDIIYFWVARMIFMGLEEMGEKPFSDVYIHGLIRDSEGRKMSKSLGNGIDPLDVIDRFGADTLRFTLVTGVAPGADQRFYWEKVEGSRNFANKLWNAARFALLNLEDYDAEKAEAAWRSGVGLEEGLELADRWILTRLQQTSAEVDRQLRRYELGEAARVIYDFTWNELCDWYIEAIKPRLWGREGDASRRAAQTVLAKVLGAVLRLLHPFMPFITEELWQSLPKGREFDGGLTPQSIMIAPWPKAEERWRDAAAEKDMNLVMGIIRTIRNLRAEADVAPAKKIAAILLGDDAAQALLKSQATLIESLAGVGKLTIESGITIESGTDDVAGGVARERRSRYGKALTGIEGGVEILLPLADLIDVEKERARLAKEKDAAAAEAARLEAKLGNEGFIAKAPTAVVERERERLAAARDRLAKTQARLAELADL